MDNDAKVRPLYLAKILYEQTDEINSLSTAQLIEILEVGVLRRQCPYCSGSG